MREELHGCIGFIIDITHNIEDELDVIEKLIVNFVESELEGRLYCYSLTSFYGVATTSTGDTATTSKLYTNMMTCTNNQFVFAF